MNLVILVLTVYMHVTTSLETKYLPFKIIYSGNAVQASLPLCLMHSSSFLTNSLISVEKQTSLVKLCLLESDSLNALKSDKCTSSLSLWGAFRRQIKRICLFLDTAELYKGLLFCNLFSRSDACVSNTLSREEV